MFSYLTLSSMLLALLLWSVPSNPLSTSSSTGNWERPQPPELRFDRGLVGAGAEAVDRNGATPVRPEQGGPAPTIHISRSEPLTQTTSQEPANLIQLASLEFGVDPNRLLAVAWCESRLDPEAAGADGEIGVMQFRASTFKANGKALGYRLADITSTEAQVRTAALMFSRGQAGQWTCQ